MMIKPKKRRASAETRVDPLTFIDLFCGAGGFTQGMRDAGLHHLGGVDSNAQCCESYGANHGAVLCADVRALRVEDVRRLTGTQRVDVVVASPPCQSVSAIGSTANDTHANDTLFMEAVRIATGMGAVAVVIENVARLCHKMGSDGKTLAQHALDALDEAGYRAEVRVLDSADYDVPQTRQRAFVVGIARSAACSFQWPSKREGPIGTFGDIALTDAAATAASEGCDLFMTPQKMEYYVARKKVRPNFVRWVDPLRPCYTLLAGYHKSRGAMGLVVRDRKGELMRRVEAASDAASMRMLTLTECRAIQTFPPQYKLCGSVGMRYVQVGNAVPCAMAAAMGSALIAAIGELRGGMVPLLPIPPPRSATRRVRFGGRGTKERS